MSLHHSPVLSDAELTALLRDDAPFGDLTTETLGIGQARGQMVFRARVPLIVCAVEEAVRLIGLAGAAARGLPVACTRKQAPGTKALSVKAVRGRRTPLPMARPGRTSW